MKYRKWINQALLGAIADTPKGCCIACDRPLKKEKRVRGFNPKVVCATADCRAYYQIVYRLGRSTRVLVRIAAEQEKTAA